jgi:DNA (cytosine-5)-methyltransferase 1
MTSFTFVDLCAGIGGFHLGLAQLGGRCVLACDIDKAARMTYGRAFPETPLAEDIWRLAANPLELVPPHDLLCAGLPCQPFSKQGRGLGLADPRGKLFFALLAIVCARRPRYVVIENVRALAGSRHRATWDLMVRSLRAVGYRVSDDPVIFSPHLLPPKLGGSPQRRERVFLLAERVGEDVPAPELIGARPPKSAPVNGWNPARWHPNVVLQDDDEIPNLDRYRLSPRLTHIVTAWNALVRALPAGTVPAFPLWADHLLPAPRRQTQTPAWRLPVIAKNRAFYEANRALVDRWQRTSGIAQVPASRRQMEWHGRDAGDLWKLVLRFRTSGLVAHSATWLPTLLTKSQEPIIGWRRRKITPREAARLQGLPDSFPLPDSDSLAYRQIGNAVHPGVVAHVVGRFLTQEQVRPRRVTVRVA